MTVVTRALISLARSLFGRGSDLVNTDAAGGARCRGSPTRRSVLRNSCSLERRGITRSIGQYVYLWYGKLENSIAYIRLLEWVDRVAPRRFRALVRSIYRIAVLAQIDADATSPTCCLHGRTTSNRLLRPFLFYGPKKSLSSFKGRKGLVRTRTYFGCVGG